MLIFDVHAKCKYMTSILCQNSVSWNQTKAVAICSQRLSIVVQCRASNAINNEHFMKMFCPMLSICSLLQVKLRRCIWMCVTSLLSLIQNVSQRATLLLSKLHAWTDKLDGRSMLSVNQFLKISSTFPTEMMRILSSRRIANTKGLNV